MAGRASIARHPVHPMLVTFPIALWVAALVCDLIHLRSPHDVFWKAAAFYAMAGGLIGALAAAGPGLADYLTIADAKVRRIGTMHLVLNLLVVALYAANLWIRHGAPPDATNPVWLSAGSLVLLVISGWLGGEMVYVHGVAVDPQRTPASIDVTTGTPRRAVDTRRPA